MQPLMAGTVGQRGKIETQEAPQPLRPAIGRVEHLRFSGSLGGGQPTPAGVSLYFAGQRRKLMSYNAEAFYRTNAGKNVKDAKSIQALADVILHEDPDVIALQEVGDRKLLDQFNRRYLKGRYPKVVIFQTVKGLNLRVAMMAKSNIRVVEAKSHYKTQCDGGDCGKRDFLEATFETDTGYRFTVFDAHFKSMKASAEELKSGKSAEEVTMPIRLDEATKAARIMRQKLQADPNTRFFATGDFNTLHTTPFGKPVIETLTLADDNDPRNDLAEVMLKDGKADPTHNGKGYHPNSKLDYTFASPGMAKDVVSAYVSGDFQTAPWSLASDHLPLVTVFEEPDSYAKPQRARGGRSRETWENKQYRKYKRLDYTA